jgi:hypothetical protein
MLLALELAMNVFLPNSVIGGLTFIRGELAYVRESLQSKGQYEGKTEIA